MLSTVDRRDLRWLEIGHYVGAGFGALWTAFSWFMFDRMDEIWAQADKAPQAEAMSEFMEYAMIAGVAFQASFVVTLVLVGLLVRQRAGYVTCFVLSIWNLFLMPFGTAAGIFTFILLRRPGIEAAFKGEAALVETQLPTPSAAQAAPAAAPALPSVDPTRAAPDLQPLPALHYALAVVAFLLGCFPILHVVVGLVLFLGPAPEAKAEEQQLAGSLFVGIGLVFVVMAWVAAAATAATGRFISQRRRYTFCLVVSAVNCMFFPFGTALGVYTLIVLNREYVKAEFSRSPGSA